MFKFHSKSSRTYKIIVGICSVIASAILVAIVVNFITKAGTLDPSGSPVDTSKTLDDIYCAMTENCTPGTYGLDSPAAPAATMHTLQQIYDKAVNFPLVDASRNASFQSGAATCYNATVISACPVSDFPGQDAEYTSSNSFTSDMNFTDNGNGTVSASSTGLMWQKCSFGLSGTSCGTGTATTTPWRSALADCDAVLLCNDGTFQGSEGVTGDCATSHSGTLYDDWRLPNIRELQSIVDYATSSPAVAHFAPSTIYFPATVSAYYWSSTSLVNNPSNAWIVYFSNGNVSTTNKTNSYYVRCVRGL